MTNMTDRKEQKQREREEADRIVQQERERHFRQTTKQDNLYHENQEKTAKEIFEDIRKKLEVMLSAPTLSLMTNELLISIKGLLQSGKTGTLQCLLEQLKNHITLGGGKVEIFVLVPGYKDLQDQTQKRFNKAGLSATVCMVTQLEKGKDLDVKVVDKIKDSLQNPNVITILCYDEIQWGATKTSQFGKNIWKLYKDELWQNVIFVTTSATPFVIDGLDFDGLDIERYKMCPGSGYRGVHQYFSELQFLVGITEPAVAQRCAYLMTDKELFDDYHLERTQECKEILGELAINHKAGLLIRLQDNNLANPLKDLLITKAQKGRILPDTKVYVINQKTNFDSSENEEEAWETFMPLEGDAPVVIIVIDKAGMGLTLPARLSLVDERACWAHLNSRGKISLSAVDTILQAGVGRACGYTRQCVKRVYLNHIAYDLVVWAFLTEAKQEVEMQ